MNGAHQLLAYADDVNLQGDKEKNTETLTDASKEVGLEINDEETKYICCYLETRIQVKIGTS
jgi:hypothetical protein